MLQDTSVFEGKLTTVSICIHVELSFNAVTDTYWTVYKKTTDAVFKVRNQGTDEGHFTNHS